MLDKKTFTIQSIDIVSVKSAIPRSDFSSEEIDFLANNYLKCGGNISPIIVEIAGLDEYQVVEGHLEFYAAKRAREIDKFFELIRAIILDSQNHDDVLNQFKFLEKLLPVSVPPSKDDIEQRIINLDNNINNSIDQLRGTVEQQSLEIKRLRSQYQEQSKYIEGLTQASKGFENISQSINEVLEYFKSKKEKSSLSLSKFNNHTEKFNQLPENELAQKLELHGIQSHQRALKAASLIVLERQNKQFSDIYDVINRVKENNSNRRMISKQKMSEILNSWIKEDTQ
ncbi:MAG: hypothetical protein VKL20_03055 [Synechocystis sp.]|nr:hypothetical protein [Synechocystis sp.]